MVKQINKVSADDFAQVVSCLGYITTIVGLALPKGPQQDLAMHMGDELIDIMLKYSSEEQQKYLKTMKEMLLTEEADTSVAN